MPLFLPRTMVAGAVVEDGMDWSVKVNSPADLRASPVNRCAASLLVLRGPGALQVEG